MLKQFNVEVLENNLVALNTYKMVFNYKLEANAGQFINIKLDNHFLRRPISISKINDETFEIIYKIKGEGTKDLSNVHKGEYLDILAPLGNGFSLVNSKTVLLIGGGIGIPPLVQLYEELKSTNNVKLLIGLNNIDENLYCEYNPIVCTLDNSGDFNGNVIEYLNHSNIEYDYVYACGPMGMLNEVNMLNVKGQISIEERRGCGFGGCVGCTCKTVKGEYKRICVEGPVFNIGELNLNEYGN